MRANPAAALACCGLFHARQGQLAGDHPPPVPAPVPVPVPGPVPVTGPRGRRVHIPVLYCMERAARSQRGGAPPRTRGRAPSPQARATASFERTAAARADGASAHARVGRAQRPMHAVHRAATCWPRLHLQASGRASTGVSVSVRGASRRTHCRWTRRWRRAAARRRRWRRSSRRSRLPRRRATARWPGRRTTPGSGRARRAWSAPP